MLAVLRSLSGLALAAVLAVGAPAWAQKTAPVGGYTIVKTYPHDATAFTEGLFYRDGFMMLLVEGVFTSSQMFDGDDKPAKAVVGAVKALIAAYCPA